MRLLALLLCLVLPSCAGFSFDAGITGTVERGPDYRLGISFTPQPRLVRPQK